jgi:hypothetical protein
MAWTQGLHHQPLHQPYFCKRFFEIGSCELFVQSCFKLPSSWSLPSELLGLQRWAAGTRHQFSNLNTSTSKVSLVFKMPHPLWSSAAQWQLPLAIELSSQSCPPASSVHRVPSNCTVFLETFPRPYHWKGTDSSCIYYSSGLTSHQTAHPTCPAPTRQS